MQNGCRVRDLWRLLAVAGAVGAASVALASEPVKPSPDQKLTKQGVPTTTSAQLSHVAPKAEPVKGARPVVNKAPEQAYVAPPGVLRGPGNDTCDTAAPISIGGTVFADTTTATPDPSEAALCPGNGQASPGVWYTFVGDGSFVRVSTCAPGTTFDTVVRVFEGTCGALNCVTYIDDGCVDFTYRSWTDVFMTVPGVTYYILLTGYSTASGIAELSVINLGGTPVNDECDGALPLLCNSTTFVDNSTATTNPADPGFSCHFNGPGTQGVGTMWYTFVATDTSARLQTCGSVTPADDSLLAVYDSCGGFEIACNDDNCGWLSRVDIEGLTVGNTYTVQFASWSDSDRGTYLLELICPVPPIQPGDTCATAFPIASLPFSTTGDTSTFESDGGLPSCGDDRAPGVWYSLVGTGTMVRATLCNGTAYDSVLSVYTGDCGALSCVTSNDDFCGVQSQVVFPTVAGQTYYIVVRGFSSNAGFYTLDVESMLPPANDECANAEQLFCNSTIFVDNTAATTNPADPGFSCHFNGPGTQGVGTLWYTFVATETSARLQTCGSVTPADDSLLAVYDSCGGFEIACNEDFCGLLSRVDIQGLTVGNTYTVQFAAWSDSDRGTYLIELICPAPPAPANDDCFNAEVITSLPFSAMGDTSDATAETVPACGVGAAAPSVWYTFTGTGGVIEVSLCNGTSYDSALAIYTGDCNSLTCVGFNDDACGAQSRLTFFSSPGVQYYIVVRGFGSSAGAYFLEVTDLGPPGPGDVCATAIEATVPGTYFGDTSTYTADAVPACGPNGSSPSVWYSVVGNGNRYQAILCNGTSYDSAISVYTGDCDGLVCVANDDDGCGVFAGASMVTWVTVPGQTYYIMVGGFGTAAGFYSMDLVDIGPPCHVTLPPGGVMENESDCGLPDDFLNGGCNSPTFAFGTVSCGVTIFGNTAYDDSIGFRDTDWYLFELAQDDVVTITVHTEFPGVFGFVGDASGALPYNGDPFTYCDAIDRIAVFATTVDDCMPNQVSAFLTAGTWVVFVSNPFANVMCGTGNNEYLLLVETSSGCGSTDCNGNGVDDAVEIAANPALDCYNPAVLLNPNVTGGPDGILDVCQCAGNFNRDGGVNSADISSFLTGWLAAVQNFNTNADIDCSGSTNSADISAFLNIWLNNVQGTNAFDGCP